MALAPLIVLANGRYAMARRTAGGSGASAPLIERQRISFSSKSLIRSYSLKSKIIDNEYAADGFNL